MLFCNVFLMRDNAVRESHLVLGHNKEKVHARVRSLVVDMGSNVFQNWDEYTSRMIEEIIEDGGEKFADNSGGIFVEWLDPTTIHLEE